MRVTSVSYGFTQNLGNFQSQRLDVTVSEEDGCADTADGMMELAVALVREGLDIKLSSREEQILRVYRESETEKIAPEIRR